MIEGGTRGREDARVEPWSRVAILFLFLVLALILSRYLTGSFLPADPKQSLIFQGSLLLIVLGSAVLEHKFTKPADSAVNALMGIVTLIPVYRATPNLVWWLVLSYCVAVFFLAVACVAVSSGPHISDRQQIIARLTYRPAVALGSARILYSILFLFGLFTFYQLQSTGAVLLLLFWGLFVVVWPLGLPELLSGLSRSKKGPKSIGRLTGFYGSEAVRQGTRGGRIYGGKSLYFACVEAASLEEWATIYPSREDGHVPDGGTGEPHAGGNGCAAMNLPTTAA
jgi:uncharacterized protein